MQLSAGSCPLKLLPSAFTQTDSQASGINKTLTTKHSLSPHPTVHSLLGRAVSMLLYSSAGKLKQFCLIFLQHGRGWGQLPPNIIFLPVTGGEVRGWLLPGSYQFSFTKRQRIRPTPKLAAKLASTEESPRHFQSRSCFHPIHCQPLGEGSFAPKTSQHTPRTLAVYFEALSSQIQNKNRTCFAPGWQSWSAGLDTYRAELHRDIQLQCTVRMLLKRLD